MPTAEPIAAPAAELTASPAAVPAAVPSSDTQSAILPSFTLSVAKYYCHCVKLELYPNFCFSLFL